MANNDWVDDDHDAWVDDHQAPSVSQVESGLRGAAQGLSLGFADEITGGLESLLSDKPYAQARDESRANYHKAQEANPMTYGAGQVGGSVATAFIPGVNTAKGAVALGGLAGLGGSDAEDVGGMALDTAKGAGLGLASRAIMPGAGKLSNTIDDIATAPLGGDAPRGLTANALNLLHRAGKGGNELIENAFERVTPSTGDAAADRLVGGLVKGASKIGRYGVAGKAQAALDTMEYGPMVVQKASQVASPVMERLSQSPFARGLAERSPLVMQSLLKQFEDQEPYDGTKNVLERVQGTKYQPVLQTASQRGGSALGATHFILQSTDPDYRRQFETQEP